MASKEGHKRLIIEFTVTSSNSSESSSKKLMSLKQLDFNFLHIFGKSNKEKKINPNHFSSETTTERYKINGTEELQKWNTDLSSPMNSGEKRLDFLD